APAASSQALFFAGDVPAAARRGISVFRAGLTRRVLRTPHGRGAPATPSRARSLGSRGGERDAEGRADVDLARELDLAAVALDDHQDRRQTQAGAFAFELGREERLEDVRLNVLVDA